MLRSSKVFTLLVLTLVGMTILLLSCEKQSSFTVADIHRAKIEVDSVYTVWWNAWLESDLDTWLEPLSNDVVMIGWPAEFLSGKELVKQAARRRMLRTVKATEVSESERLIWQVHVRENVVWVEARQRVVFTMGSHDIEKVINQTTLFEPTEQGWKIMQHHCSYGACESIN